MKNHLKSGALTLIVAAASLSSCKKDKETEQILETRVTTKGIYVLNEGAFGGENNSSISYYDVEKKTTVEDYYKQVNSDRNLGTDANDLKQYGSKLYCVVTGRTGKKESFVDVMNVNTGKTIKRISLNGDTEGKLPRFVAFFKNKAYVSNYDGTISRIDTASLNLDGNLQLKNGDDNAGGLEGLAVANGKLYVTNSAHGSYPNSLKSKVTVIDLTTFTKSKDIEVGSNPVRINAAENGYLYVMTWNVWGTSNTPILVAINSTTDAVIQTENYDLGTMNIAGNNAWVIKDLYSGFSIKALNVVTGKLGADLISDGTTITTPYGLTINPSDNSVILTDAVNYAATGKAFCFGTDGKLKYSFDTGANPKVAAFNYSYSYVYKSL